MPQFRYLARSADGKLVDGVVTSNDRSAAIRQVEQQRFVPIRIEAMPDTSANGVAAARKAEKVAERKTAEAAKSAAAQSAKATSGGKPGSTSSKSTSAATGGESANSPVTVTTMSHSQQHLFTEQLANLLGAGMTLDEALGILVRRMKHPKLHSVSRALHQALVDGRSLSQALRDFPRVFSPLYVNMVAAGEASGALSDILRRLVAHLAEVKALKDRVQQALLYPAMLVLAGIALIIIFMTVMVPQLTSFFKESGSKLPDATLILLKANDVLTHYWWAILLGLLGTYLGWQALVRNPTGRAAWDTLLWRLPVYGMVIRHRFYAQFARTLGTLVENGVTLLRALDLLEEMSGNEFVREKMGAIRGAVMDGATLSTAAGEQNLFPELFIDMMSVGEQTGRFGTTMNNIADVYERELDKQVQVISTLIPPLVMMVVAGLVGFIVFGILSAVFGMTQTLRGGAH